MEVHIVCESMQEKHRLLLTRPGVNFPVFYFLGIIYLLSPIILLNKYTHIYEKFQFLRKLDFFVFIFY